MAEVSLRNVEKRFGAVLAVRSVSLDVAAGEFLVIVGPSGCGKSTILRMIAGLESVTAGEIHIGDRLVNDLPPKDRDIAMVFQNYALYPHMTAYENMAFSLRMRKLPTAAMSRRVQEVAEILGIGDLLQRRPGELSGGQRQRVALGRAMVRDPRVFLMDEPLSSLDAKLRVQMRTELSKLHRRLGTTTIHVTHDQVEAMTMGDRIVVMKDGLVQQVAPPLELYERPANAFVAGFIGSPAMNFTPGRLEHDGSRLVFVAAGLRLPMPGPLTAAAVAYSGRDVLLGVRPEDIVAEDSYLAAHPETCVDAWVEVVELLGAEGYLHLKVGPGALTARVGPSVRPREGERIPVAFRAEAMHLFDPVTEIAIR